MKPKFVFALLFSTLLIGGIIFFAKQSSQKSAAKPLSPALVETETAPIAPTSIVSSNPSKDSPASPVIPKPVSDEQRRAAIDAETERLSSWAMQNDSQSLSNILGDLTSPEKEIRTAAIEAAKQFGNAAAIPTLKAIAAKDNDAEEQTALLDAADFLSLPGVDLAGQNSKTSRESPPAQTNF